MAHCVTSLQESFQSMQIVEAPAHLTASNYLASEQTSVTSDAFQGIAPSLASATSNYSSVLQQQHHDVFVNHRGPDVKEILAIPIHDILSRVHGLQVFVDSEELQVGDMFSTAIQRAIRGSCIHIAIFSPTFASSPWCLAELFCILKIRAKYNSKLIPVYYNVEQTDLQYIHKGAYAEAFVEYERKGRYPKVLLEEWKTALHQASFYPGLYLHGADINGDKEKLLYEIVGEVLRYARKVPLDVAAHPVGMEDAVHDFQNFIESKQKEQQNEETTIIGIVGMGGSGKTTLAKELFNRKQQLYSRSSFLFDVREMSDRNGLSMLHRKLLQDLVKVNDAILSSEEGKTALYKYLKGLRVLIVLDDISNKNQLDNLLVKDILDSESWIIVTSRDKAVLQNSQIKLIYDIKKLEYEHAKELFCRHAFLQHSPIDKYESYIEKFVKMCDGLPLSLKIVAGQLSGRHTVNQWEAQLQKFSKELDPGIGKVLSCSYESLEDFERQIFLDVACFFYNETKDLVLRIWDDWRGLLGLQMLENKCLLEVDDNSYIKMHDHLRDFGRMIANSESPFRIWHSDNIKNLLAQEQCKESIKFHGIMAARGPHLGGICVSRYNPPFKEIEQLTRRDGFDNSSLDIKLLTISGSNCFRNKFSQNLTRNLKWLRWYDCPLQKIPEWLSMENLHVLEILASYKGNIKELWRSKEKVPRQLKELSFVNSRITALPESIALMKYLEKLKIEGDLKIKTLPDKLCSLRCLKQLELRYCEKLQVLPDNIGNLKYLEHIDLTGCKKLKKLPSTFTKLRRLSYLSLCACYELEIQHENFKEITTLQYLNLNHCRKLKTLSLDITFQEDLKTLDLRDTSLESLPNELWKLNCLEILRIGSQALVVLPSFHKHLSSLKELSVEGCQRLEFLQDSIASLKSLRKLNLENSGILCLPKGVEELTRLESLCISNCPISELKIITTSRNSDGLPNPKRPRLCVSLTSAMSFLKVLVLRQTDLHYSISISADTFPHLEEIDVSCNQALEEILKLPERTRKISLEKCIRLRNIDGISNLTKLRTLDVSDCRELEELPSFCALTLLEKLKASDCWKLQELKGIERLSRMSELVLRNCYQLKRIPSLENLSSLTTLDIQCCHNLRHIEGLQNVKSLDNFTAGECWELQSLKGLENLKIIRFMELPINKMVLTSYLPNVQILPEIVLFRGRAVPNVTQLFESLNNLDPDMSEAVGLSCHNNDESHWQLIFLPDIAEKPLIATFIVVFIATGNVYVTVFSVGSQPWNEFNYEYIPGYEFVIDKSQWLGDVDAIEHWLSIEKAWMVLVKKGEEIIRWSFLSNNILPAFAAW